MVPNGWEHKAFGEVVKLSKSKYDPKKSTDCFPCIELEHIVQETGQLTGNVPASNLGSTKNKFKAGDVIFGKLRPYLRKYAQPNFDGVCSSEIWVFSPTKKIINSYLFQLVQTNQFISEANKSAGSKMPRADWGVVSEMIFPLPPLPEQRKIAQILSTWDKAITTTEQLLANSQQQKKALMQQLLTGKKRLLDKNGVRFSGEWKKYTLGELGDTFNGLTGKTKDDFGFGKKYIPYINIFKNSRIDVSMLELVDVKEGESQSLSQYGDIFFTTSSETPEEVGMSSVLLDHVDELYLNSFCFGYRLFGFESLHPEFACYLLRSEHVRGEIAVLGQGATRYNLSKKQLMKLEITLPPVNEQKKIATVLSTADQEISALQQKLDALKQEKKALMQQLLTGKRRVTLN